LRARIFWLVLVAVLNAKLFLREDSWAVACEGSCSVLDHLDCFLENDFDQLDS